MWGVSLRQPPHKRRVPGEAPKFSALETRAAARTIGRHACALDATRTRTRADEGLARPGTDPGLLDAVATTDYGYDALHRALYRLTGDSLRTVTGGIGTPTEVASTTAYAYRDSPGR